MIRAEHPARRDRGALLIILLILMVVITVVGVWGLQSSKEGITKAGHYRGSVKIQYEAEEGLQRAVQRLQEIADETPDDSIGMKNGLADPGRELTWLLDTLCNDPDDPDCDFNLPCSETFVAADGFDVPTAPVDPTKTKSNVICNFLGTTLELTQVALVRKEDFQEGSTRTAVFLINSISRDTTGRRRIFQGVAIIPYLGTSGNYFLIPNEKVRLATTWLARES